MQRPEIDDKLVLVMNGFRVEALCTEVLDDPRHEQGTLIRVMVKEDFHEGDRCWIEDDDGSKIGALVESVVQHSVESEITLAVVLSQN